MPETSPLPDVAGLADALPDVALLFTVGSNTRRLQILVSLASGRKAVGELAGSIGAERKPISQHIEALRQAGLVSLTRQGNERSYELTDKGHRLLRMVRGVAGGPETAPAPRPPERDDSRQGSVDALCLLLKTFADPIRLRLLGLLSSSPEVCVCHLHEALELPQSTVSRHLAQLREAGLIVGQRRGQWVYYRLAHPASDLHQVLLNHLPRGFVNCGELEADRERLKSLLPCSPPRQRPICDR